MCDNKEQFLKREFDKIDIRLSDSQAAQFLNYYNLLIEWNKVINLTGIVDYEEVVQKHFIDSVYIYKAVDMESLSSVIDIGTGAGFPGIPLKILYPHINLTLLDSLNKRIKFLKEVCIQLGLNDILFLHGRAEDYGKDLNYRESYELCISRAVADLSVLSEYCIPFLKTGGKFVSYKSGSIQEELMDSQKAIKLLGGEFDNILKFQLSDTNIKRSFVIIKKINKCPNMYPRKAGMVKREPIK